MEQCNRRMTVAKKAQIVLQVLSKEKKIEDAAAENSVSGEDIQEWIQTYKIAGKESLRKSVKRKQIDETTEVEESDVDIGSMSYSHRIDGFTQAISDFGLKRLFNEMLKQGALPESYSYNTFASDFKRQKKDRTGFLHKTEQLDPIMKILKYRAYDIFGGMKPTIETTILQIDNVVEHAVKKALQPLKPKKSTRSGSNYKLYDCASFAYHRLLQEKYLTFSSIAVFHETCLEKGITTGILTDYAYSTLLKSDKGYFFLQARGTIKPQPIDLLENISISMNLCFKSLVIFDLFDLIQSIIRRLSSTGLSFIDPSTDQITQIKSYHPQAFWNRIKLLLKKYLRVIKEYFFLLSQYNSNPSLSSDHLQKHLELLSHHLNFYRDFLRSLLVNNTNELLKTKDGVLIPIYLSQGIHMNLALKLKEMETMCAESSSNYSKQSINSTLVDIPPTSSNYNQSLENIDFSDNFTDS